MSETDTKRIIELKPEILLAYNKAVSHGFDGTMSDYINKKVMEHFGLQTLEYPCVFKKQKCPVKQEYKLKPESLVLFCNVCPHKTAKTQLGNNFPALMMMNALLSSEKQEKAEIRKLLLDLMRGKTTQYVPVREKAKFKVTENECVDILKKSDYWNTDEEGTCGHCNKPIKKRDIVFYVLGQPIHTTCIGIK